MSGSIVGNQMGRAIAIANQKGGVGKTTTAINLAASLAAAGKTVLLIDLDPQGNATSGLGVGRDEERPGTYDLLIKKKGVEEVIINTAIKGLYMMPSRIDLVGAEVELIDMDGRETVLRESLSSIRSRYDFILIDCPPSLGFLTINALTASDSVLIPVQCEYYAMEGLGLLLKTIELIRNSLNQLLVIEGILLTMFDNRNNLCRQVAEEIRAHFNNIVYRSLIPRNIVLAEAPSYGMPVLLYNITSRGAEAYLQLAGEMLKRCKERH